MGSGFLEGGRSSVVHEKQDASVMKGVLCSDAGGSYLRNQPAFNSEESSFFLQGIGKEQSTNKSSIAVGRRRTHLHGRDGHSTADTVHQQGYGQIAQQDKQYQHQTQKDTSDERVGSL